MQSLIPRDKDIEDSDDESVPPLVIRNDPCSEGDDQTVSSMPELMERKSYYGLDDDTIVSSNNTLDTLDTLEDGEEEVDLSLAMRGEWKASKADLALYFPDLTEREIKDNVWVADSAASTFMYAGTKGFGRTTTNKSGVEVGEGTGLVHNLFSLTQAMNSGATFYSYRDAIRVTLPGNSGTIVILPFQPN
mmetsp:Transcript_5506/g.8433  ORF Transcript_5506/g.8433 Transcript_5506/m.8433 type:complete len:190 (-) Transcript_5506:420-989(-)